MVKNPVRGKVKTRLASAIGDDKALQLYDHLLKHTADIAAQTDCDRFVFYSDDILRNDDFSNDHFKKYVQCGGELGVRMEYAFSIPFKNKYKKAVMIGSDCYDITPEIIQQAFEKLDTHDFVLGPALDGGYYLIGMKRWNRWIFENKNWSTASLFSETKTDITSRNSTFFELPAYRDIDTIADVQHYDSLQKIIQ